LDPQLPMLVVPGGIEPSEWPRRVVDWPLLDGERPVRFLMIGQLAGRKDPFRVLGAWRELMAGNPGLNAELVVHTFTPGVHPAAADYYGPKIRMSQRALSRPELVALYRSCDVLVSASRGEGNNKPALEFQATGGTAIVPDWGGPRNWLHEAATGLPGELVPAMDAPGAVEFAVDHDELVKALWRHASDPVWVADRGQRCASAVRARMSWRRTLRPLVDWLAAS
jgi:glycosyltransferase involved in cell wall biosynthesis